MRPHGTPEDLERRRRHGIALLKTGATVTEVARRLGCSHSSVIVWRDMARRQGVNGLKARPASGRPPKLTARQQRQLPRLLLRGAMAWGVRHGVVDDDAHREHHPTAVWRAVASGPCRARAHHAGLVVPEAGAAGPRARCGGHRALETLSLGRHQNKAQRLNASLVFLDESGFLLIPTVRQPWAPRGQTPIVHHRDRRDKISAISAISVSARRRHLGFYVHFHPSNITHVEVAVFLRALLRHLRGAVVVVWDGGSIHQGPDVRALRARHPRLYVERFPGYAPELNPDEFVWAHFKAHLANGRPDDVTELLSILGRMSRRLRRRPDLLRSFVQASELTRFL